MLAVLLLSVPARLLVLDTMVPGQRLRVEDAPPYFRGLVDGGEPLVVVGRQGLALHARGAEVVVAAEPARADGVVLATTGRVAEIVDGGDDEGSRWRGRAGAVRWLGPLADADDALSPEDAYQLAKQRDHGALGDAVEHAPERLARASDALGGLVDEWLSLVRASNRERAPGQLDALLSELGPMPAPANARAVWCSALINPLPALGVALEVRPAVLTARSTARRLAMAEHGLRDSIARLRRGGPLGL